ncbi:hypothetical protein GCM10027575_12980 [Phytohabitans suffuscus]
MRDPDPRFAERVATGAGDFAAGVASLLRSLSAPPAPPPPPAPRSAPEPPAQRSAPEPPASEPSAPEPPAPRSAPKPAGAGSGSRDDGEDVWRAATRASHDPGPD